MGIRSSYKYAVIRKTYPLTEKHFDDFIKAYHAENRSNVEDERWNVFTREEIAKKMIA